MLFLSLNSSVNTLFNNMGMSIVVQMSDTLLPM